MVKFTDITEKSYKRSGSRLPRPKKRGRVYGEGFQQRAASVIADKLLPGSGSAAAYVVGRAQKAYRSYQDRKVTKNHGADHPTQQIATIDNDTMTIRLGKIKPNVKKRFVKGVIRQMYTNSSVVTQGSGIQGVEDVNFCGVRAQFLTSTGTSYSSSQIPIGLFNSIPENLIGSNAQATSYYNGKASTVVSQDQIYYEGCTFAMDILNASNAAAFVDIYCSIAKIDQDVGFMDQWIYTDEPYYTTQSYNTAVTGNAINSSVGGPSRNDYNIKPKSAQNLRKTWKILGVKSYPLAPGANQSLDINVFYNMLIDKQKVTSSAGNVMKGKTFCITVVARGALVATAGVNTGSNQDDAFSNTWSSTNIRVLTRVTHRMRCLKELPARANNINLVTNNARTAVAIAGQTTYNPTSNATATVTQL